MPTDSFDSNSFLQKKLEKTQEDLRQTQEQARKDLEESEERFRILCEEAGFLIVRTDRKGRIIYTNKIVANYGLKREDVIGKNMREFVPRKHWPKLLADVINVRQGRSVKDEIEIDTPYGRLIVEYRASPIKQRGKFVGILISIHNITERKKTVQKLENYDATKDVGERKN